MHAKADQSGFGFVFVFWQTELNQSELTKPSHKAEHDHAGARLPI